MKFQFLLLVFFFFSNSLLAQDTLYGNIGRLSNNFSRVGFQDADNLKKLNIRKSISYVFDEYNDKNNFVKSGVEYFDKKGRLIKEKAYDIDGVNILYINKYKWISDSLAEVYRYFPQQDTVSRFLLYDFNEDSLVLYQNLLSDDYKSKFYTTRIRLLLDKNMRCSQYQYYDYKGKICLYFNPFFGGNKLFSKTVSDTLKENDLIKRIDCQTFYSKQTINKRKYEADTTNTRYLFEYDDKKRVIHKLEINKQYKNFIDSITYDYTYFDENQIKTLERRNVSKNSNKYYSKEENFFDTHGKLVKNVATDQNESSIRVTETIHKGDTSIENTYFSNRKEQLRKGFMSVYYKNVSILHESYNENSKVEYRNKRLYRRRFHF